MPRELTRGEIAQRMERMEVDQSRFEELRGDIEDYLASGIVGSTLVGRHYTVSDPRQREELAGWVTDMILQAMCYRQAVEALEEEAGDGE